MAADRSASVTWTGDLMSGSGTIDSVTSGVLANLGVSWPSRSEEPGGQSSPEELIAANVIKSDPADPQKYFDLLKDWEAQVVAAGGTWALVASPDQLPKLVSGL